MFSGYGHLTSACFLLLEIASPERCRRWIAQTLPRLTTWRAPGARKHPTALNLALTWTGLQRLGLGGDALDTFPEEFRQGMARRAGLLGDTGESAPETWELGGERGRELHVLLMLYARPDALEALVRGERGRLAEGGLEEVYCQWASRSQGPHGYYAEPFGFRDGISQPVIEGFERHGRAVPAPDAPIKPGEFVLGAVNEHGLYPRSPSVPREADAGDRLPPVPGQEDRRDLGYHGTWLVLRKLRQDVGGFWDFVRERAREAGVSPEWLAARMVGRWPNGAPLEAGDREQPPAGHRVENDFLYSRRDARGEGCPLTSHVRRCNPRDSFPPDAKTSLAAVRRHRIIRRGMSYGVGSGDDPRDGQGLVFIALNADLAQQFEFIQQNWINDGKFGGYPEEPDPLVGPRGEAGDSFTIPACPVRHRVHGLPRFVQTRGGAYFFLPGRGALEFLANLPPR